MFGHVRQSFRERPVFSWLMLIGSLAAVGALTVIVGYVLLNREEEIDVAYGRRTGSLSASSVNGTAVLAQLFENAGHKVRSKRLLTDAMMASCDVIVWAPDSFEPPSLEVIRWFDQWLAHEGRTLIYVGRDYDSAPLYYDKVIPGAPATHLSELRRRRTAARTRYLGQRQSVSGVHDCDWFTLDMQPPLRKVDSLSGPWSEGIDASLVEIELRGRIKPKLFDSQYFDTGWGDSDKYIVESIDEDWEEDDYADGSDSEETVDEVEDAVVAMENYIPTESADILLRSKDDILVSRQIVGNTADSRLIVVTNGSFLLNLPLVNHEHRALATRLVAEIDSPQTIIFVESDSSGLTIVSEEPTRDIPTGFALFAKRPIDVILFHMAILGIVFCMARWPIFGRPKRLQQASLNDFGKHVEALGELLEKTNDRQFALTRLRDYEQSQRTESAGLIGSDDSPAKRTRSKNPYSPQPTTEGKRT